MADNETAEAALAIVQETTRALATGEPFTSAPIVSGMPDDPEWAEDIAAGLEQGDPRAALYLRMLAAALRILELSK